MTYDYIKKESEKLDNDPNYKFPNWQTMLWVMEYRAAKAVLRIQATRKGTKR